MPSIRSRRIWGDMLWRRTFPGQGDQAAPARRFVRELLLDTERADDAEWIAAELVSNALRHTRSREACGYFVVEVLRGVHEVRVAVYDLGGYGSPKLGAAAAEQLSESGHGLPGVSALAINVGVGGDPISGHVVWAQLALNPAEEAHGQAARRRGNARPPEIDDLHGQVAFVPDRLEHELAFEPDSRDAVPLRDQLSEQAEVPPSGDPQPAVRPGRKDGRVSGSSHAATGGIVTHEADQVSAYGQEPWAQRELQSLRREWGDWAFLVVRYRWIALYGAKVMMSAPGPGELRAALPPAVGYDPTAPSGAASDPGSESDVSFARCRASQAVDSVKSSGILAGGHNAQAALPARRTKTGSFAVVENSRENAQWWQLSWWRPRRRGRQPRPNNRADPAQRHECRNHSGKEPGRHKRPVRLAGRSIVRA
ncbi:ATP-binding protein [Acrocarpospora corrugata]